MPSRTHAPPSFGPHDPRLIEWAIDPPTDCPDERFTVWLLPFTHDEVGDYLDALAAVVLRPADWAKERCRRLAERIARWDVPDEVNGAAMARLPAWAPSRIEAALLSGLDWRPRE